MTNLYFLRHGETDWNVMGRIQGRTDIPLNSNGVRQAKESSEFLTNLNIDYIVTSPLKRAQDTAKIVQEKINVDLIVMEEFIELSFGDAEGMTLDERLKLYPDRVYPNQEEESSFKTRFSKGLDIVQNKYRNKNVLIVSHGALINAILYHYSHGEIGTGKIKLTNGGITSLEMTDEKVEILEYNKINHLSQYNRIGEI